MHLSAPVGDPVLGVGVYGLRLKLRLYGGYAEVHQWNVRLIWQPSWSAPALLWTKPQSPKLETTERHGPNCPKSYLEGQGDLVTWIITPITHIVTLAIPLINLLTKSP